jgi:alkaline phosphatase D
MYMYRYQKINLKVLSFFILLLGYQSLKSEKSTIYTAPIIGSITKNSAKVCITYKSSKRMYLVISDTVTDRVFFPSKVSMIKYKENTYSVIADFTNLQPSTQYHAVATIENAEVLKISNFTTLKDTSFHDFSFTLGSCALMQPLLMRTVFPGSAKSIFKYMQKVNPNFMVWLGDNVYYLPQHHKNYNSMFKRILDIRSNFKDLNQFLSGTPQYAIWDDHDYGPNDSGKDWELKDTALVVFKHFWPNSYPEQDVFKGNFFNFTHYDAEFFMMDVRFFRDHPCDTCSFLGETQLIWLKNKLIQSTSTFKFIAIGTQLLNTNGFGESYDQYTKEKNELLDFITQNNIKGVVFLSGDKHYSEICMKKVNNYPIYDITASPLTTPALPRKLVGAYKNNERLKDSDYAKKNFGHIRIYGQPNDRTCEINFNNRKGVNKRSFKLKASELQIQDK